MRTLSVEVRLLNHRLKVIAVLRAEFFPVGALPPGSSLHKYK